MSMKARYIVLTGPFRSFETEEEATEAADNDTEDSRTEHAVVSVMCHCPDEPDVIEEPTPKTRKRK